MDDRIEQLYNELVKIITPDTVFACIGAVRTTSYLDSIGPQVGDILKANKIPFVYGTHDKPYNGLTANSMTKTISKFHPHSTVIAIDTACALTDEKLYKIQILNGCIKPGAGVNKKLTKVGDYAIKAFMLSSNEKDLIFNSELLSSNKCGFLINKVDEMVHIISAAILKAYQEATNKSLFELLEIKSNKEAIYKLF
jgi:putative sporulation protein YyaC